jgi:hypothetical protein
LSKVSTRSGRSFRGEGLLVGLAAAGAFVFINHENLYLTHPFQLADVRIESYALATIMMYLFLRLVILAFEMRPTRALANRVRCPECGQWLDARTAAGLAAHRRIELTPKPSQKEVVAAVALRRAVDATRLPSVSQRLPRDLEANAAVPPPANAGSPDVTAAQADPDYIERMRHSPTPQGPRLKR